MTRLKKSTCVSIHNKYVIINMCWLFIISCLDCSSKSAILKIKFVISRHMIDG